MGGLEEFVAGAFVVILALLCIPLAIVISVIYSATRGVRIAYAHRAKWLPAVATGAYVVAVIVLIALNVVKTVILLFKGTTVRNKVIVCVLVAALIVEGVAWREIHGVGRLALFGFGFFHVVVTGVLLIDGAVADAPEEAARRLLLAWEARLPPHTPEALCQARAARTGSLSFLCRLPGPGGFAARATQAATIVTRRP